MKTLLVTPFAPYRDGIATYALQELRRLRDDGEVVEVCSPEPSAARWHLPLGGPAGVSMLVRMAGDHDRVVVQFGPELAFGRCRSAAERVAVWLGLAALARRRPLELRIHEIEYGPIERNPMERWAARLALSLADCVTVHTGAERDALDELVGLGRRVEVVDHGRDFRPAVSRSRTEARADLGLAPDGFLFVAIGFLQHHKGFDLAVDAIDRLNGDLHLHLVGSARVDHPDIAGYVDRLRGRCAEVANATLHERFVSDVEFDLWLQAADWVVLPYREIWSSGVLERARLFGTPVLASDLPQLRDQAPPGTVFFGDVDELSVAMDKLHSEAAGSGPTPVEGAVGPTGGTDRGAAPRPVAAPWTVDAVRPDRAAIQRQIVGRARATAISETAGGRRPGDGRRPVDGLLALGPLHRPQPTSARPGVAPVKRLIDRLIGWQVDPLASRLEALQRATIEAVAQLDAGEGEGGASAEPDPAAPTPPVAPPPPAPKERTPR